MHILLLGATGATGRHLLPLALDRGLRVTALVRDASKLSDVAHEQLTVVEGDAADEAAGAAAMGGVDAVVSVLGAPASSRSGIRGRATEVQLRAMARTGVDRLISLSSLGVGDSAERMPWYLTWLVVPFWLKHAFADHEVQERLIRESDVRWTLVRPTFMNDKPATGAIQPLQEVSPKQVGLGVTREDVARFMVDEVAEPRWVHRAAELVGRRAA